MIAITETAFDRSLLSRQQNAPRRQANQVLTAQSRTQLDPGEAIGVQMSTEPGYDTELLERRRRVLGAHSLLFYEPPLNLVRGAGVWLFDARGKRYLDAYNNVSHVGHSNDRVAEAVAQQCRLLNTHTRYLNEGVVEYAERLVSTLKAPLRVVTFCCTGTEANELALRMARHRSGARGIIVSDFSYHGNSGQFAALSTALRNPEPFPDWARVVSIPNPYSEPAMSAAQLGDRFVDQVCNSIASLQNAGHGVAALLLDPLFSFEGLPACPAEALAMAVEAVRRAGGSYIADEVQGGLGRTGRFFWAHERYSPVPDLVTIGKPMANGIPMAAVVTSSEIVEAFGADATYFNTFGGNPVACAAAMATLDVLESEALRERATAVGAYMRHRLLEMARVSELIGDVRGEGHYLGVEIVENHDTRSPAPAMSDLLVNKLARRGVLLGSTGPRRNVLKIRPPMPFSLEHADIFLDAFTQVLAGVPA
jgi:4-aminobutyrate aminotransferase-like enzyme